MSLYALKLVRDLLRLPALYKLNSLLLYTPGLLEFVSFLVVFLLYC